MKTLLAAAMLLAAVTAAQAAPQMPAELIGEWCGEGGACPDGVMRATSKGFTGSGAVCLLERVRQKAPNSWLLNFKCNEPGRPKNERFEETWMRMDEMLVVFIQMKDRLRTIEYRPRTSGE
jgi:hypothetical protein